MLTADPAGIPSASGLVDLRVTPARAAALLAGLRTARSVDLGWRQLCDLELLATGACSPLTGFMTRGDYDSVCAHMRLAHGTLWPMPITLDVNEDLASALTRGDMLALRDAEGVTLAALTVEDIWRADLAAEAEALHGTSGRDPAGVAALPDSTRPWRVGGPVEVLQLPIHHAFRRRWRTPAELRAALAARGWTRVIAFQASGPMHRAERELTLRAARDLDASVLIHPAVGLVPPDDPDFYMLVRCWEHMLATYPDGVADLNLVPLAPRMAGAREALWRAIVSRNYGCTHVLIPPDHAAPVKSHAPEIGIEAVSARRMMFVPGLDAYLPHDEVPAGQATRDLSPAELRALLENGGEIPDWFSFPSIVRELRHTHPPRSCQGFTVFFTGLSGSGKSTIANALLVRLMQCARRPVTLLDGDIVRKHLSSELGFSKEHRDLNIRRIGYVASEITKAGAVAICCPIAPYDQVRQEVRALIEPHGGFVLTFLATPLEVCEQRDRKGLYAKARAGTIKQFTGISDPYEAPLDAEVAIDTTGISPDDAADRIVAYLRQERYLTDLDEYPNE
ncbi:MAG TPA: bifunctional sulfate adenylyltransferase/adenylylsulfate kinase [Vicinamibacterales bacterium]